MGKDTSIEWSDHTFNGWWGCSEVSPGCEHCYARELARRFFNSPHWMGGVQWGPGKARHLASDASWNEPLTWDETARKSGKRAFVFASSMCDVFDNEAPQAWRERLWGLIKATPHLDWLLLTKRIGNAARMLPANWRDGYPNAWLGATVVTQEEVERDIPKLLAIRAVKHFLSCEPLLEAIDISAYLESNRSLGIDGFCQQLVDWVIVGAESGRSARPMDPAWVRSLRDQCAEAGTAFFFKQDVKAGKKVSLPAIDGQQHAGRPS